MSFINKVVVITGSSSGIGAAAAIAFNKEGANVVIVGRNEKKLNSVVEKCSSAGKKALVIKADITHDGEAERIVKETVNAYGKIDILVNNAGLVKFVGILESGAMEAYDLVMNTNLRAQIQLTHIAAPFLIKSKGNIVIISSVGAFGTPNILTRAFYDISKAALHKFTIVAAAEFAKHAVRVNAVSPGPVKTDIYENCGVPEPKFDTPLKQTSDPEEIADLIMYLASDKAKGITGSDYVTDNGYLLKN